MSGAIVVTGVGGPAGRSLAVELAARDLPVLGVDMRDVRLAGIETAQVPPATDPAFLGELLTLAARFEAAALIPTVSEELPVLAARSAAELAANLALVLASNSSIRLAADKWLTCTRLADGGVEVPRFALAIELAGSRSPAQLLGTPWLTKPRIGRGARGVTVHGPKARVDTLPPDAILQEFVPGDEYSVNLYLGVEPVDDVAVVLRKTGLTGGSIGNATAVERVAEDDVGLLAVDAARTLGLTGPVDVDVRRRASGEPVVLEVNARVGANCARAPELIEALVRHCAPNAWAPV